MTQVNSDLSTLQDPQAFSADLYERMAQLYPGVAELTLLEFRYALENLFPPEGWASVTLAPEPEIEQQVNDSRFYQSIRLKPEEGQNTLFDPKILSLTRMLLVGLATGAYSAEWIDRHFYFDVRGFYFLHRTRYYSEQSLARFGGRPYRSFTRKQAEFASAQSIGYPAFQAANAEIDRFFIESIHRLVAVKGTPVLVAIAGPTAAGKTEIVARLRSSFEQAGHPVTAIEMDHFLTDRDDREAKGIDSLGKDALHYEIFLQCLRDICCGKKISTPRYDFVQATSSHTLDGKLKEGCQPVEIEPADVIFIEGNFPFLLPEVAPLIGIKAVYLTDDDVRLKRKWKRDMDYRKKYEPGYFLNRYFREQFLMAEKAYIPQIESCDLLVDTTRAEVWAIPSLVKALES
jgi:uridine kinase